MGHRALVGVVSVELSRELRRNAVQHHIDGLHLGRWIDLWPTVAILGRGKLAMARSRDGTGDCHRVDGVSCGQCELRERGCGGDGDVYHSVRPDQRRGQ